MPKVYVVQQHLHKDELGIVVPKYDLTPATEYGELVFCFGAGDMDYHNNPQGAVKRLRSVLKDITPDDFILPIGSTTLMCLTAAVAAEYTATLNFLYWSRKDGNYKWNTYDLEID